MKKIALLIWMAIPFFVNSVCQAQDIEVSDPRLELMNNNLYISYDIIYNDPSAEFTTSLQITDETGAAIEAKTLTGDIGNQVQGGSNKRIIWDLKADNIKMNASIFVKVHAKLNTPLKTDPVSEPAGNDDLVQETQEETGDLTDANRPIDPRLIETPEEEQHVADMYPDIESFTGMERMKYSRAAIILQSVPLPGLGLSRVTGNPHWIRGAVGYACIGGSIGLNRAALNTYEMIPEYSEYDDKNDLFIQSQRQDDISEILAYAAIGIWTMDIIWTILGTSDLQNPKTFGDLNGFSFRSSYDPLSQAPLIGIRYVF